jgi:hypothetical protein
MLAVLEERKNAYGHHPSRQSQDGLADRPLYLNPALYSPLAGLLAVAAAVPRDRYEVVLTDENIEAIDFRLKPIWSASRR